jgi:hypothetical protein
MALMKLFKTQFNNSSLTNIASVNLTAARYCEYVLTSERSVELPYNDWDITSVLSTLNEYFVNLAANTSNGIKDENPIRCAKTILNELITQVGQKTLMTKCQNDLSLSNESIICSMIALLSQSHESAAKAPAYNNLNNTINSVSRNNSKDSAFDVMNNENINGNISRSSSANSSSLLSPNALKRSAIKDKVNGSLHTLSMVLNGDLMDGSSASDVSSTSGISSGTAKGGGLVPGTGDATEVDLFARFNRIFNRNN